MFFQTEKPPVADQESRLEQWANEMIGSEVVQEGVQAGKDWGVAYKELPKAKNAPTPYGLLFNKNFFNPEGDLGNANNCGPGFFSFLANLNCDDDTDEDCDESDNVNVFANPSQSFIGPCGGSTPADAVDVNKMQKYWYDPVPIEYVGVIDTINHEDFLTFEPVINDDSGLIDNQP